MTLLRIYVGMVDTDKAAVLLRHLEDVASSRHTRGTAKGKTVVMDVAEEDVFAVKQLLSYYNSWIASS